MIRPRRLERRLDAALAPVVDRLDNIDTSIGTTAAKVVEQATARVADAEQRVTAATAQAGERVLHAERQAASAIDAIRAELADERDRSVRDSFAELVRERDDAREIIADLHLRLDGAIGERDWFRAEAERLGIERNEARRQHDEMRAKAHEAIDSCDANLIVIGQLEHERSVLVDQFDTLADAARAVLGDLADGLPHRPHGGSRTRARRRMEALAALVEPTADTIEWTGDKSYVVRSSAALVEPTADTT